MAALALCYNLAYAAGGPPHSKVVNGLVRIMLPLLVVWWIEGDARHTGYWPAHHYAAWLFATWPVSVPHYLIRTRGRSGWPLSVALLGALISPYLGWALGVGLSATMATLPSGTVTFPLRAHSMTLTEAIAFALK